MDSNCFLVLGAGERYSLTIDSARAVETACAFFREGFGEGVAQDASTPVEAALDDPTRAAAALPWICRLHYDPERRIIGRVQTTDTRVEQSLSLLEGFELVNQKSGIRITFSRGW